MLYNLYSIYYVLNVYKKKESIMQVWERTYKYIIIDELNGIPVCKQPFGYIYCIWNTKLHCPVYVGQSKYKQSHKKTITKFKNYFGSGLLISRFIKKNGKKDLYKEICDYADNQLQLNKLEREIIKYYNTLHSINMNGLNLDIGGNFPTHAIGWHHTIEAKQKIANASKKRWENLEYREKLSKKAKISNNSGRWKKGHSTWNKGLTKEMCPKLAKIKRN